MNIKKMFGSKLLKAADLHNRRTVAVIDRVKVEKVGEEEKAVVYFRDLSKGLPLNRVNAAMMEEIAGTSETDEWTGVSVTLYSTKVTFQGRTTDGIRIDFPDKKKSAQTSGGAPAADDIHF